MRAVGTAQVVESKHASYVPGDIINGLVGWQDYVVFDGDEKGELLKITKVPGHLDVRQTLAFAVTGLTAYFGMTQVTQIRSTDTVLVSGAAGATGSVAGQLARIFGAKRVIGIAGGPEKCRWLTETAYFDAAIDYKNEDLDKRLSELAPDGVDVFFDNVGGAILDTVLLHLAMHARIVLCGAISQYQLPQSEWYGLQNTLHLIIQCATMQGFLIFDYLDRHATEGLLTLTELVQQGKIVLQVDEQTGFDNIPATLDRLFTGANLGKQILKLSDPPLPPQTSMVTQLVMKVLRFYYAWRHS